jgi:hypothetical protein
MPRTASGVKVIGIGIEIDHASVQPVKEPLERFGIDLHQPYQILSSLLETTV